MPEGTKGGLSVFWREFGSGPESALLLHCGLAHSKAWARMAAMLEDDLTMVAPDMPGHGRSALPDPARDVKNQVYDVALDCLGETGHVIGHSFGAVVALRLALEVPERVRTLTLIEPVLFAAARESDPAGLQAYFGRARAFSEASNDGDWYLAAKAFTGLWGDGRHWDTLTESEQAVLASQMGFIKATERPLTEDTLGMLDPGRLEAIRCPVQLLRGSETDPIIPAIHSTLRRRIPGVAEHVVEDAGHMAPITHPKAVADHIRQFLGVV